MEPLVGDGVAAVELGNVLVAIWQHPATDARWDWMKAVMDRTAENSPGGFLMLDVTAATSSPPDAALRRRMQVDFKENLPRLRMLIVVALGDSLWVSVVRTIMRAVALLSGQSHRQVVVATVAEGVAVARKLGATASAAELTQAVDELSDALGVHPPPRRPTQPSDVIRH